jgi:Bifunctional DNA primase/polymerase, N-terminal
MGGSHEERTTTMVTTKLDLGRGLTADDKHVREQLEAAAQRALELPDILRKHPISEAQLEREQWQAESNAYAEANPLYAAARSAAAWHAIIPLDGRTPLVEPTKATRDERRILEWWGMWPEANPGVPAGRPNNLIAVHVADTQAAKRLRRLTAYEQHDPDSDRRWVEHRDLGASIAYMVNTKGVSLRASLLRGGSMPSTSSCRRG